MKSNEFISNIMINGTSAEKREVLEFTTKDSNEIILKKFKIYSRSFFIRYFTDKSASFHDDIINDYIDSYKGESNVLVGAFRDAAKTSILKLFLSFVVSNDKEITHKYIKVLSKDLTNSKQIVTDVYNNLVETAPVYGDLFEKEGDKKREETMGSFTMKKGIKVSSGSVGQDQRGHLQDAYRPSWILFEDIEDRTSISSQVQTQGIINKIQEAIDGMARGGRYVVNCNYISQDGVVQWFMEKPSVRSRVIPIATDVQYGIDSNGNKTLLKATPTWEVFSLSDLIEKYKDAEDWYGEYMSDPAHSEDKFFDIAKIDEHIKNHAKEPERRSAGVKYWSSYTPNHRYGQGSDHSEGVGLDSNALIGFDFKTGEQTYSHASNTISPDLAATEYARVGAEFGNCMYAPEVNNKCGGIVITTLKDLSYPRIYQWEIQDKVGNVLTKKLGWETNRKTKNTMFMEFRRDFNDGLIIIRDIDLLKEMRSYSNNDLVEKNAGLITRHFDLLTAAVIAWQMRDHAIVGQEIKAFYNDRKIHSRGRRGVAK